VVSLHKIMELVTSHNINVVTELDKKLEPIIFSVLKEQYQKAICFDISEITPFEKIKLNLTELPYPVCWFEGWHHSAHNYTAYFNNIVKMACLIYEEVKNEKTIRTSIHFEKLSNVDGWVLVGFVIAVEHGDKTDWTWSDYGNKDDDTYWSNRMKWFRYCVLAFLSALSCNNVKKIENVPPEKLQKKRIKNGKLPLFSYWTLHLELSKEEQRKIGSNGGSHASPRLHLRRGHAREYRPGLFTWVQSCVVGNKENGLIMKDYAVKQKEAE